VSGAGASVAQGKVVIVGGRDSKGRPTMKVLCADEEDLVKCVYKT